MDTDSKPKINVIICTYNRRGLLPRAVESVLNQSYKDFELIIINNGSTDETQLLCEKYKKQDNRIKLVHIEKNIGASHGRNVGLEAASAQYIAFADDDDFCEDIMLDKLVSLKDEHNADIAICGGWNEFDDRLEPYFIYDELLVLDKVSGLDELLKREKYNVAPPAKLFKKSLFDGIPFKNGVLVDDIHTIYKVFSKADIIAVCGIPVYRWRKHQSNMTGFIESNRLKPELLEEYLAMQKERIAYLSKNVPPITQRVRYAEWSYMISMCDKIKTYHLNECGFQYNKMIKELKRNFDNFVNSPFITSRESKLLQEHAGS